METCNDAPVRHLLAVARHHATRAGLSSADADDCATAFVETHFAAAPPAGARCPAAWWNTCAHHHVLNWLRAKKRREQHECSSAQTLRADGSPEVAHDRPGDAPDPQHVLLQQAFWLDLKKALRELEPTEGKLFLQRAFRGATAPKLAERFGQTPAAVYKILSRAAKKVSASLLEAGWTQADVCRCLDSPPPPRRRVYPPARARQRTRLTRTSERSEKAGKIWAPPVQFCPAAVSC